MRTSSHILEIEKGRMCRPKKPIEQRLCPYCEVLEDEQHFLLHCRLYHALRNELYAQIESYKPEFRSMSDRQKFVFLLCNDDAFVLSWLGRFIYGSFEVRHQLSSK